MSAMIDHEIEKVARLLWPQPMRMEQATGGLFNRVVRVSSGQGVTYLKRFTDAASSGDFPPLPTTASQRCSVAASWHQLSLRASALCPEVKVPALLALHAEFDLLAMDEVEGQPLHEWLTGPATGDNGALHAVVAWLAALHGLDLQPRPELLAASAPFKAFKVDLQYTRVLPELPGDLHAMAETFIARYLACNAEPVHGDINSRNVLHAAGSTAVIDFEQGHFGEGVYDLAYLLSEYVIRSLRFNEDSQAMIDMVWLHYCDSREMVSEPGLHRRFRVHLAFQSLYRLVGPSRKVWTGHLDDAASTRLREWSTRELREWLA